MSVHSKVGNETSVNVGLSLCVLNESLHDNAWFPTTYVDVIEESKYILDFRMRSQVSNNDNTIIIISDQFMFINMNV